MSDFAAYRIFDEGGKIEGRLVTVTLDDLSPGHVVIETAYSSVNYKDALAGTGKGRIMRKFPLVGGIDVSGYVDGHLLLNDALLIRCLRHFTGHDVGNVLLLDVRRSGGLSGHPVESGSLIN